MRKSYWIVSTGLLAVLVAAPIALSQRPGGGGDPFGGGGRSLSKSADVEELVAKMMAFDENKDGSLTRAEVTDTRLVGLFNRADADKNGTVTRAELTALGEKEYVAGGGGPGGGGPGGGGPGGPGGPMGRPGEVLPGMLQGFLRLSEDQKSEVAALQKDVDARLEKILNEEQRSILKQMRERGPGGGPGGPGGRGRGPGGPGGPGGRGGPGEP